jgi:hypothetical protein
VTRENPRVLERKVIYMKIWQIDIGDTVLCDLCSDDYTESDKKGGIIIGDYAICPKCEKPHMLAEASYISRPGETFKDFVIRTRKHSTIGFCRWK